MLSIEEKEDILKTEFNIQIPGYGKELFGDMCNLSLGILEHGIEIGREIGREQVKKQFEEQGYIKAIKKLLENGMPESQIKEFLEATDEQIRAAKE